MPQTEVPHPPQETAEQAAARRAMPPFEPEPKAQDNPGLDPKPPTAKHTPHISRFTWLGYALIVLGALALVFPFFSTLATTLFIGGIFLAAGVFKIFGAIAQGRGLSRVAVKVLWGLVYIVGGGLILYAPLAGAWSLTIVLASLFIFGGAASIAWALIEPKPTGWAWMAASGALSILLGGLVAVALPFTAFWFPGIVAGIDLASTGFAFIAMDRAARAALAQAGFAS
jgi:uncharacterized membrane protein HdeD (DUF308 family)